MMLMFVLWLAIVAAILIVPVGGTVGMVLNWTRRFRSWLRRVNESKSA